VGGAAVAGVAGWLAWPTLATDPRAWIAVSLLAVALAPIFLRMEGRLTRRTNAALAGTALAVATLYAGWHLAVAALLPSVTAGPSALAVAFALAAFAALFVVQVLVSVHPHHPLTRALQAWAFAGFHLDELFTRATFLVWPPRHVRRAATVPSTPAPARLGRAA
jgi:NAD(P)H-quinone oxidoreductase subunit 5